MKKTFFIIPGFKQKPNDKMFKWLIEFLKNKNLDVVCVSINWDRNTMSDYANQFKIFYEKNKSDTNYVLGFSYGAVIAFMMAQALQPEKIFLCSLSPDFKEDYKSISPKMKKYLGKNRLKDIQKRSGVEIAKLLTVQSAVFYGEAEGLKYPSLKKRCEETVQFSKNSRLVIVKDSPHDISNPNYMESIKNELGNF